MEKLLNKLGLCKHFILLDRNCPWCIENDTRSKAWCECGHETLQDPKSKVYETGTVTNIVCSNCNRQTTWDLDAPAPLFIKSIK